MDEKSVETSVLTKDNRCIDDSYHDSNYPCLAIAVLRNQWTDVPSGSVSSNLTDFYAFILSL
jgi:hypothetical protein